MMGPMMGMLGPTISSVAVLNPSGESHQKLCYCTCLFLYACDLSVRYPLTQNLEIRSCESFYMILFTTSRRMPLNHP
jgi:hypothetical protein